MEIRTISEVSGSWLATIDRHHDDRGFFQEVFSETKHCFFKRKILQTNMSSSKKDVLRGLHVAPFAKLCTCIRGAVYDVVVDVRSTSTTYLNWYGVWLTEENKQQLYIPAGCAHGFYSAADENLLLYMQDGLYNPREEYEINCFSPALEIRWPRPTKDYIMSKKDRLALKKLPKKTIS